MRLVELAEIEAAMDPDRAVAAIRASFVAAADRRAEMPSVTWLPLSGGGESWGECHVKSAHVAGAPVFVVKVAGNFPGNAAQGQPVNDGLSLVFCARTGRPRALLCDRGRLTDIRTGIAGALATMALARPDSVRVALLGSGEQAFQQGVWLSRLWPGPLRFGLWARARERAEAAAVRLRAAGATADACEDCRRLCREADIVITATAARAPLVAEGWIGPGTHLTAVGADAPGKQELAPGIVAAADLVAADLVAQCLDHGEIAAAAAAGRLDPARVVEIGAILAGRHPGRTAPAQVTLADLTGLAVQDAAMAGVVLEGLGG